MTAVGERETSVAEEPATAAITRDPRDTRDTRDPRVQEVPMQLPTRRSGGFGAGERDLVAALLVHGYGRRPGDLGAVLAGLAETQP